MRDARWYVAVGTRRDGRREAILRKKDTAGLQEWQERDWQIFTEDPEIVEVTTSVQANVMPRAETVVHYSAHQEWPVPLDHPWWLDQLVVGEDWAVVFRPPGGAPGTPIRGGIHEFLKDLQFGTRTRIVVPPFPRRARAAEAFPRGAHLSEDEPEHRVYPKGSPHYRTNRLMWWALEPGVPGEWVTIVRDVGQGAPRFRAPGC